MKLRYSSVHPHLRGSFWFYLDLVPFHLAPAGSSKCDYGTSIEISGCENAVRTLAARASKLPGRSLIIGSGGRCKSKEVHAGWGSVPLGCSTQSGQNWNPHYKTSGDIGEGCIHTKYQLVCSGQGNHYIR